MWSFDVATVFLSDFFLSDFFGVSLLAQRIGLSVSLIREKLVIQEKSWNSNLIIFLFYNSLTR